jgi:hypothetical protein
MLVIRLYLKLLLDALACVDEKSPVRIATTTPGRFMVKGVKNGTEITFELFNRTRIESEGIGLVLLGERDGHVGIYHSSQSLQHFVYAVHRSFVQALETHYCRSPTIINIIAADLMNYLLHCSNGNMLVIRLYLKPLLDALACVDEKSPVRIATTPPVRCTCSVLFSMQEIVTWPVPRQKNIRNVVCALRWLDNIRNVTIFSPKIH